MAKKSQLAHVLDGIPVVLGSGQRVVCKPPSVASARRLMRAYNMVVEPPLPETATPDEIAANEAGRRAALAELMELFPEAVGQPTLADHLSPGDILRLLPGFFWKTTGARVATPAPRTGTPSGTPAGSPGSPATT